MSKRHLSDQQKRRIKATQTLRSQATPLQTGLVIGTLGKQVEVKTTDEQHFICHLKQTVGQVLVGDTVRFEIASDRTGLIVDIEPRQMVLTRPDHHKGTKDIVANIDLLLVVATAVPPPSALLLDRYLVISALLKLPALLVFNKQDLLTQAPEATHAALDELIALYQSLGYATTLVCAHEPSSLRSLAEHLSNHRALLTGQSGVGKSALINGLTGSALAKTAATSTAPTHKGQHTTTTSRLYCLPAGGQIVDSPGIREFGLWNLSDAEITEGFKEFLPWATHCQFRNCNHFPNTPNCGVIPAIASGALAQSRYHSYQQMRQDERRSNITLHPTSYRK